MCAELMCRLAAGKNMRQKRFTVAAAELGGSIYATGGYDSEQYLATVERFDPREGSWYPVRQPSGQNSLVLFQVSAVSLRMACLDRWPACCTSAGHMRRLRHVRGSCT